VPERHRTTPRWARCFTRSEGPKPSVCTGLERFRSRCRLLEKRAGLLGKDPLAGNLFEEPLREDTLDGGKKCFDAKALSRHLPICPQFAQVDPIEFNLERLVALAAVALMRALSDPDRLEKVGVLLHPVPPDKP
jgi:hypothetical protein